MNSNPKVTNIPLNAAGGLMTNIPLTMLASKVEVMEDPSYNNGALQGLQGYYMDTQPAVGTPPIMLPGTPPPQASPAVLQTWLPNDAGQRGQGFEPIIFGGIDGRVDGGYGDYVGAQNTVVLQLTTAGPNPGGILLVEWA